ncbi:glycosyltransferase [Petroclostridium sp. X23]|uniref:glycosyltransferase n=1 Tax=Petroclostridium sp. X23 TaxID=3045146 RepID=UPI0024ADBAFE|nr:glycosyltransferase [Petroclostridium sp. X23]WHH59909.1 glycosyltransferase [Petroclostridium sp. X23]
MILGYTCNRITQSVVRRMLIDAGQITKNYLGKDIPNSMGIALILSTVLAISISLPFGYVIPFYDIYIIFAGILMGFVGLIDDFAGNSQSKGFKGHMKNLMHGKLTTGGLKAITGVLSAFIISVKLSDTFLNMIIYVFFISLLTNLINLTDTRPGRAVKVFFLLSFFPLLIGAASDIYYIVFGVLVAYLPMDLRAKGMLGDTGANFIGMILGITMITMTNSLLVQLLLLGTVLILNMLSEKYSFSKTIERNRFLNYIDHLGRNH